MAKHCGIETTFHYIHKIESINQLSILYLFQTQPYAGVCIALRHRTYGIRVITIFISVIIMTFCTILSYTFVTTCVAKSCTNNLGHLDKNLFLHSFLVINTSIYIHLLYGIFGCENCSHNIFVETNPSNSCGDSFSNCQVLNSKTAFHKIL